MKRPIYINNYRNGVKSMVDDRVASAVRHWAPRMVANGIDYNDFIRATARIDRWDQWCGVWSGIGEEHLALAEAALADGRARSAAQHYVTASMAFHFGKFLFVDYPHERRVASQRTITSYAQASALWPDPVELVRIPADEAVTVPAVLRKPPHGARPPVVILIPGLDSVKEELHRYGDDFLDRGMAVLAIDGPGQGALEDVVPMRPDYEVIVSRVVDFIQQRPDLNGSRIGVMGVSVGGYYAARAAAREPRIHATIESGGAYCLADDFDAVPELTRQAFTVRSGHTDPSAARTYLLQFTLEGLLSEVSRPLLIIHGGRDRLFPVDVAQRIAEEAGEHAELWIIPEGNHLCNNMPYAIRPRQADWMKQMLM